MGCLKCVCSYSLLLLIFLVGFNIVAGSTTCPTGEFIEERAEVVETVQASVKTVFSKVLNDSTIANDSLSEVYERVATSVGLSATPTGYVQFQEAISEVIVAKSDACSTIDKSKVTTDYIKKLTKQFVILTDAKNITLAREIYGKLLCLQDHLTSSDKSRAKRQADPSELLKDFFDSLDGKRVATIFGVGIFSEVPPTLAFVVDDTGSMSNEINSVRKLIHSFIKTERSEPLAYILTTFNDPGSHSYLYVTKSVKINHVSA